MYRNCMDGRETTCEPARGSEAEGWKARHTHSDEIGYMRCEPRTQDYRVVCDVCVKRICLHLIYTLHWTIACATLCSVSNVILFRIAACQCWTAVAPTSKPSSSIKAFCAIPRITPSAQCPTSVHPQPICQLKVTLFACMPDRLYAHLYGLMSAYVCVCERKTLSQCVCVCVRILQAIVLECKRFNWAIVHDAHEFYSEYQVVFGEWKEKPGWDAMMTLFPPFATHIDT